MGFVRRQTGGRGVLHDKELTYSAMCLKIIRICRKQLQKAFVLFREGLLDGFKALG